MALLIAAHKPKYPVCFSLFQVTLQWVLLLGSKKQ